MEDQYVQAMTIAGSDSDGSAGMQADMHTFFTRNVYGVSVMTACVAGNSYGIGASVTLPTDFIDKEFELIAKDFQIRAAKTGMLADSKLIETVVKNYQKYDFGPLVVGSRNRNETWKSFTRRICFAKLERKACPFGRSTDT
jgi:hydroxymethylpyrimidine/phosphomethylpyrimidine kinase